MIRAFFIPVDIELIDPSSRCRKMQALWSQSNTKILLI